MIELQKLLRLRSFGFADWRSCLKAGADAAWATDRGEPIVQAIIAHLRANNVLFPTVNVLERIGLAARARARKKVFELLADGLTAGERAALEKLLAIDPELRRSRFAWLRDYSESPAPSNIVALLDRLEYARSLGIGHKHAGRIHPDRLNRLVGEGAIMTVQHIADLEPTRRTAMLVAQAASLETRLSDGTLAMFEKYMARCSPGRGIGMNGVSRLPVRMWPKRCCCCAARSPRSGSPRRPARRVSPSLTAKSA
jgi:hypothetical protein